MYLSMGLTLCIISTILWFVWIVVNTYNVVNSVDELNILTFKIPILDDVELVVLLSFVWLIISLALLIAWPIAIIVGVVVVIMKMNE